MTLELLGCWQDKGTGFSLRTNFSNHALCFGYRCNHTLISPLYRFETSNDVICMQGKIIQPGNQTYYSIVISVRKLQKIYKVSELRVSRVSELRSQPSNCASLPLSRYCRTERRTEGSRHLYQGFELRYRLLCFSLKFF